MKITKIKTKMGEFGAPVSVDLSAVVERMRSPEIKAEASKIAAVTLHSRLMAEQGSPRYYIIDNDRLPYLIFSATFGKEGLNKPTRFTSLLLLNIPCPKGLQQVAELKNRLTEASLFSMSPISFCSWRKFWLALRSGYASSVTFSPLRALESAFSA